LARPYAVTPGQAQKAPAAPWSGRFENGAAGSSGASARIQVEASSFSDAKLTAAAR